MKILWLSHFIPYPPKGGVLQRGYHLVKETAKHHELHLLAFNQKALLKPLFSSVEEGVRQSKEHLSDYCKSITLVDLPADNHRFSKYWIALKSLITAPYTMNWLFSKEYGQAIIEILAKEKFDYIHFDTISLAPFKKYCGDIPTSLDHHNIESHMLLRRAQKESNLLKKMYYYQEGVRLEKYEKMYCPQFNFNFTCSDVDTQRLKDISPKSKVFTIPNGVDVNFFKPNKEVPKEKRLIFIGRLNWYPNTEAIRFIVKEIWPRIKDLDSELVFDIVGANPPDDVVALAEQEERLNVHGFVDDISYFFDSAIAYICPIKDGGGTKLKILDALASANAIIADPIACEGIDVTAEENVLFAVTGDEYAAQIKRVLDDETVRTKLEENARQLAEKKYAFESIGKALSDLFNTY
ncbi:glycosyltransferase family 4 protein [Pleionea sediminis]|uniref:glycosyltransferase family 4 protein n=1 Tax=Pleionea sediminis TaxID=2569479 RepID=UPI001186FE02|nr:glycosyltransferase family 4 protein [Pleionea sediminis]